MRDWTKLKIGFLTGSLSQGGAERQLYYVLQSLSSLGAQVHLYTFSPDGFWLKPIQDLGVPVIYVGGGNSRLARLKHWIELLNNVELDVLQGQHFFTNAYVGLAARYLGLTGIGALRSDGYNEVVDVGKVLGSISLNLPHRIASNSRHAIQRARKFHLNPDRLVYLPNVVDTSEFHPVSRIKNSSIHILYVGSLLPVKRVDRLLSVLKSLDDIRVNFVAHIAGDGPLLGKLKDQAAQLGILNRSVYFLGGVENPADLYRNADIFLLTSEYEGVPNVILEAMASGLPVVSTRVGGISEIIENNVTGFLVEPDDMQGMAERLERLVRDAELRNRLGMQARDFAKKNHSLAMLPENLDLLYRDLCPI